MADCLAVEGSEDEKPLLRQLVEVSRYVVSLESEITRLKMKSFFDAD